MKVNSLIKRTMKILGLMSCAAFLLACAVSSEVDNPTIKGSLKSVKTMNLDSKLLEISGLSTIDNNTLAAVQDEDGILFIYDLKSQKIKKEIKFGESGDYEAVAIMSDNAYVLRSDAKLFKITNYNSSELKTESFDLNLEAGNNESLCFDSGNKRLIAIGKDKFKGGSDDEKRPVFAISLDGVRSADPIFYLDIEAVNSKLKEKYNLPEKSSFLVSDIEIDPKGKHIWLLSLQGSMAKVDFNGDIIDVIQLDTKDLIQPEGLTFTSPTQFYISSEGQKSTKKKGGAAAKILSFNLPASGK